MVSAAIRLAFSRFADAKLAARLYETRTLDELRTEFASRRANVALVEVRRDNLPQVIDLLSSEACSRASHIVALMDYSLWHADALPAVSRRHRKQRIANLLREAGAQDAVDSPRRLKGLLQLSDRLAVQCVPTLELSRQSIAAWAQSVIPWQDT